MLSGAGRTELGACTEEAGRLIEIRHRISREVRFSVPPSTATLLRQWMENAVEPKPESFVFAGETGQPLWRSSLPEDYIKAKLEPVGLGWVNFQVMRRTHASLGHHAKVDPKVSADQRGHGIGVAMAEYIQADLEQKLQAMKTLDSEVIQ